MCEFGNIDEVERVYPYEKAIRNAYFDKLEKIKTRRRLFFYRFNRTFGGAGIVIGRRKFQLSFCTVFGGLTHGGHLVNFLIG